MKRPVPLVICLLLAALAACGQRVEMSAKPIVIAPGAAVGNKARLRWTVQQQAGVLLQLLDASGKVLRTLDAGNMAPGEYDVVFDGSGADGKRLPAGAYTVRLSAVPKAVADAAFGVGGMLGQVSRTFTFRDARIFDLGAKGIDAASVRVKVDGDAWHREADFAIAGNTFTVDAAAGTVELNPTGVLDPDSEVIVTCARGLPLENPYALDTAPDGALYIADYLYGLDAQQKKPAPRPGFLYKVDAAGRPVAAFGKEGRLALPPKDVAVDADGSIYVVTLAHAIAVYDSFGKPRYQFADFTGSAGKGEERKVFGGYNPVSLALSETRRAVVCNANLSSILYDATKPNWDGFLALQEAKQGAELPPVIWQYLGPCLAARGDSFYMTTYYQRLVKYRYDMATKEFSVVWSTSQEDSISSVPHDGPDQLWMPLDVEVDGTGLIYVADRQNHRVQIFFDAGTTYKHVGSLGSVGSDIARCQLMAPHALAVSPDRRSLYVADDGIFIKHQQVPVVKGLARVVKWTLAAEETLEAKLTIR